MMCRWKIARLRARLARDLWVINTPRITLSPGINLFGIVLGSRLNHTSLICRIRDGVSSRASLLGKAPMQAGLQAQRRGIRLFYWDYRKDDSAALKGTNNTPRAPEADDDGEILATLYDMNRHLSGRKPRRLSETHRRENVKAVSPETGYRSGDKKPPFPRNESQDESNVFGTLAKKHRLPGMNGTSDSMVESTQLLDPDDLKEQQFLEDYPLPENRMWPDDYGNKMKALIKEGKLKEALEMLFVLMLKEDRVKPNAFVYNVLIGGCGRAGYTKMAFKLFTQMRQRGLPVTGATYTGLFNACAQSPWPDEGLVRARKLRQTMQERGWVPNTSNYHVMIKAFGRCGDLQTAFELVDEMVKAKHALSSETMNFLLMACLSDKEAGFKHSIEVWRKFLKKHVRPDVYSYNILLRCMRECGAGSPEFANELLKPGRTNQSQDLLNEPKNRSDTSLGPPQEKHRLLLTTKQSNSCINNEEPTQGIDEATLKADQTEDARDVHLSPKGTEEPCLIQEVRRQRSAPQIPNLLYPKFDVGDVVALSNLDTPYARLMVLGGFRGILHSMVQFKTKPNIKTFSELLQMAAPTLEAEEDLLLALDQHGIQPDIDFFNLLIKKRNTRHDFRSAKDVLTQIQQRHLYPDIATFGVLAIGCFRKADGQRLLADMEAAGFRPNIQILGALVKNACNGHNWPYVCDILKTAKKTEVNPDAKFLETIEAAINDSKKAIVAMERGKDVEEVYQDPKFKESFRIFMMYYKQWAQDMELDLPPHPWDAYRIKTDSK